MLRSASRYFRSASEQLGEKATLTPELITPKLNPHDRGFSENPNYGAASNVGTSESAGDVEGGW